MKGCVYILTNPTFKDKCIKIGQTTNLEKRIKDLSSTTSVPTPFEKYATLETVKYKEVETLIHKMIDGVDSNVRVNKKREFFEIEPSKVLDMFYCIKPILEDDAEINVYVQDQSNKVDNTVAEGQSKSKNFTFSMVGINVGETITFEPAHIDVTIYSDTKISYNNETYTMSGFTKKFMPDNRKVPSGCYQGPKYFSYKGSVLTDLRKKTTKQ